MLKWIYVSGKKKQKKTLKDKDFSRSDELMTIKLKNNKH